jgi:hypothetical protein
MKVECGLRVPNLLSIALGHMVKKNLLPLLVVYGLHTQAGNLTSVARILVIATWPTHLVATITEAFSNALQVQQ